MTFVILVILAVVLGHLAAEFAVVSPTLEW